MLAEYHARVATLATGIEIFATLIHRGTSLSGCSIRLVQLTTDYSCGQCSATPPQCQPRQASNLAAGSATLSDAVELHSSSILLRMKRFVSLSMKWTQRLFIPPLSTMYSSPNRRTVVPSLVLSRSLVAIASAGQMGPGAYGPFCS